MWQIGFLIHDKRSKRFSFELRNHVFLRVTPIKGVGRVLRKNKLTSRFIGPYQVLKKIGAVAYRVCHHHFYKKKPHNVFHVSQLMKYVYDASHII